MDFIRYVFHNYLYGTASMCDMAKQTGMAAVVGSFDFRRFFSFVSPSGLVGLVGARQLLNERL